MGDGNLIVLVAGLAQHQPHPVAFLQDARTAGQGAEADFRSLQVDQDADRPPHLHRQAAQIAMHAGQRIVRGVAHIDAEHVHPASNNWRMTASVSDAGPRVATILVLRWRLTMASIRQRSGQSPAWPVSTWKKPRRSMLRLVQPPRGALNLASGATQK